MNAADLMTSSPCCCSPDDSVSDVARIMRDNDCGSVPVVDDAGCLIGIVTDRDLAVRGLAAGKGADTPVRQLMTPQPCVCSTDDDLAVVERTMADKQVRRVPVVDADGCCVGIIAQADLARAAERARLSEHDIALVVEKISEPASPSLRAGTGRWEQRL